MQETGRHAAVVGGGPAGLMAAETLARAGVATIVYDAMPSLARKFLLAGRGGLNLTHSEPLDAFIARYGAAALHLRPLIEAFPPDALRAWAAELQEETFVGTSGRVFPKSFKATPLLRAWLRRLAALGVAVRPRHRLTDISESGALTFATPVGDTTFCPDATILALGGASWPRLGASGDWMAFARNMGVEVAPLLPANCGFEVAWSDHIRQKFAGAPLKSVALRFGGQVARGGAVLTAQGIEGGAVYALSAALREAIARQGDATLEIDLRPDLTIAALTTRLAAPRGKMSIASFLRKAAGLTPVAAALLREIGPLPADSAALAARIKGLPLRLIAPRPLARAISTAGGVRFESLDDELMARLRPGLYFAGEMLDWEAPTGGYLLQACFATGFVAGRAAAMRLRNAQAA